MEWLDKQHYDTGEHVTRDWVPVALACMRIVMQQVANRAVVYGSALHHTVTVLYCTVLDCRSDRTRGGRPMNFCCCHWRCLCATLRKRQQATPRTGPACWESWHADMIRCSTTAFPRDSQPRLHRQYCILLTDCHPVIQAVLYCHPSHTGSTVLPSCGEYRDDNSTTPKYMSSAEQLQH